MRLLNRLRYSEVLCCIAVLLVACAVGGHPFEIEPKNKSSVHTLKALPPGTRLHLKFLEFRDNETLMLQRCGEPCNTAKLIQRWTRSSISLNSEVPILLEQGGRYYFWIQRRLESGEVGPVFATSSKRDGRWLVVTFNSGTTISIGVDEPVSVVSVVPSNTSLERTRDG
jgi:hypothetical protein